MLFRSEERKAKTIQFVLQLQEDARLNDAKIAQLEAQAVSALAMIDDSERNSQIGFINAQITAAKTGILSKSRTLA